MIHPRFSTFALPFLCILSSTPSALQAQDLPSASPGKFSEATQKAVAAEAQRILQLPPATWGAAPTIPPTANFKVHRVSKYGFDATKALAAAQPGDVVVFDHTNTGDKERDKKLEAEREKATGKKGGKLQIVVSKPVRDVQFIGGEAEWTVSAEMAGCSWLWHTLSNFQQTAGSLANCVFYRCSNKHTRLQHVDGVTFYYCGDTLLWPAHNPDEGKTPQFIAEGFVRALTIHKPLSGYAGINKRFDMAWAPALRVNATDTVGNGYGTYVISPIIWAQRSWTPYQFLRGTGMTFAHVNTEYNIWADPILETDQTVDFTVLATGVGANGEASNKAYQAAPQVLAYADGPELGHDVSNAPFRGAGFCLGGQRNKLVAQGNYKGWDIGRKQWLPGLHYASGTIVRDPFYSEWVNHSGEMTANFSDFKNVSLMRKKGWQNDTAPTHAANTYPVLGPNLIRPSLLPVPDIRAWPSHYEDMTGKTEAEILAVLEKSDDKGKDARVVVLGPGTYRFTKTLQAGKIFGAGMGRTILEWPAELDCAQRAFQGFRNLTVRGGRFGVNYQVGTGGSEIQDPNDFVRVRFEGQQEAGINLHATQNQIYQDCEFIGMKNGFGWNLDPAGEWKGERGASGLNIDKLDITNCTFRNIAERAIDLRPNPQPNGQVAIHNCLFENIGKEAVYLRGGQSHLLQNLKIIKAGTADPKVSLIDVGSRGCLAFSHIFIDNTGVRGEHTGISAAGDGVTSHAILRGVAKAIVCNKTHSVDHVSSDGELEVGQGSYITLSKFANVDAEARTGFFQKGGDLLDVSAMAGVQPLDTTPPPLVTGVRIANKGSDQVTVTWQPVTDVESGVVHYGIYAGEEEIARTSVSYEPPENFHGPFVRMQPVHSITLATAERKLTVKAINGAGLVSGGGTAPHRTWAPVRGQFFRTDGTEVVLGPDVKVSSVGNPGQPVSVTLADGTVLDSEKDLKNKSNPSFIVLPAGKLVK